MCLETYAFVTRFCNPCVRLCFKRSDDSLYFFIRASLKSAVARNARQAFSRSLAFAVFAHSPSACGR